LQGSRTGFTTGLGDPHGAQPLAHCSWAPGLSLCQGQKARIALPEAPHKSPWLSSAGSLGDMEAGEEAQVTDTSPPMEQVATAPEPKAVGDPEPLSPSRAGECRAHLGGHAHAMDVCSQAHWAGQNSLVSCSCTCPLRTWREPGGQGRTHLQQVVLKVQLCGEVGAEARMGRSNRDQALDFRNY
jgi:hypothetical protein